jgi:hypothetical protein
VTSISLLVCSIPNTDINNVAITANISEISYVEVKSDLCHGKVRQPCSTKRIQCSIMQRAIFQETKGVSKALRGPKGRKSTLFTHPDF